MLKQPLFLSVFERAGGIVRTGDCEISVSSFEACENVIFDVVFDRGRYMSENSRLERKKVGFSEKIGQDFMLFRFSN